MLAQARAAHAERKLGEARRGYDEVIRALGTKPDAEDIAAQARAFRALLDQEAASGEPSGLSTALGIVVGLGVWILIGLGVAAIFSDWARQLWITKWHLLLGGLLLTVVLIFLAGYLERWLIRGKDKSQRALIILLVVPLIVVAMMALIVFGTSRMAFALELVLILIAALIPAAAYYLFLATRRPSILNEFVGNLGRLGLLAARRPRPGSQDHGPGAAEAREARRARIESYFQRFEAIYGALRFEDDAGQVISRSRFVEQLIHAVDTNDPGFRVPQGGVRITDIFRPTLIIPIGLVTVLTTLGWLLALQPDFSVLQGASGPASSEGARGGREIADLTLSFTPMVFAFLGAYFFGIQMLFRRFVRRDLGPNAYFAFANRIILALIAVWITVAAYSFLTPAAPKASPPPASRAAAEQPAQPGQATPSHASGPTVQPASLTPLATGPNAPTALLILGFVVGVFPRILWQFLAAATARIPGVKLVLPSVEAKQPLSELDGLTVWHESRLEEEDVENIPNMASVDVVDLMLHTQIPAERLIGWIDQAILYSVLGPHGAGPGDDTPRNKLRNLGLRTASQVVAAQHGSNEEKQALAGNAVHTVVHAIEIEANFDVVRSWRQV